MKRTLLIGLALALTAAQQPQQIPIEYRGNWSMDPAYCNFEGDTLDNELYVTADTVGFHAEHHRVKAVRRSNGKIIIRFHKLADAYRDPPKLMWLSKDKSMLNDVWHRCPPPPQRDQAQ